MATEILDINSPSIDIILVSDAKSFQLKQLTELAIESAGNVHNIIVIESNDNVFYDGTLTIHPKIPFNYNRYLNIGAKASNGDYIFFGNNDIIFVGNWHTNLILEMEKHNVVSASPFSPRLDSNKIMGYNTGVIFGYDLISIFCGWAFVWRRDFYNEVGGLDEDFTFWCSDNVTVGQLQRYNQRHILVTSSFVYHFGRSTLVHLDKNRQYEYTVSEIAKYNEKFSTNLWEAPHIKGS